MQVCNMVGGVRNKSSCAVVLSSWLLKICLLELCRIEWIVEEYRDPDMMMAETRSPLVVNLVNNLLSNRKQ